MDTDEMDTPFWSNGDYVPKLDWMEKSLPPGLTPTPVSDFVFEMIAHGTRSWGDPDVRLVRKPDGSIFRVGPGMGG